MTEPTLAERRKAFRSYNPITISHPATGPYKVVRWDVTKAYIAALEADLAAERERADRLLRVAYERTFWVPMDKQPTFEEWLTGLAAHPAPEPSKSQVKRIAAQKGEAFDPDPEPESEHLNEGMGL